METLEVFLREKADELTPLDDDWPDCRRYLSSTNPDAIDGDKWLESGTPYIWRIGVLAQWDSNKFDYARAFIGHERAPGQIEFVGMLHWQGGENDDIGRSLERYCSLLADISPAFDPT